MPGELTLLLGGIFSKLPVDAAAEPLVVVGLVVFLVGLAVITAAACDLCRRRRPRTRRDDESEDEAAEVEGLELEEVLV